MYAFKGSELESDAQVCLNKFFASSPCPAKHFHQFCLFADAIPRLLAGIKSDHDHIAAECARLITRLWAPVAGRTGCCPWIMPKTNDSISALTESLNSADDNQAAHHAKSSMLKQSGRYAMPDHCVGGLFYYIHQDTRYVNMSIIFANIIYFPVVQREKTNC